ncbi:putative secreted protein (Por secretion system target) [Lacinutrix venerupis]|uniref:endonuclease n=1 Tax=Lacinutrix venerupis TaxID=1486034 RepID=UPI000EB32684|nr:endonuclease [Lacinutrix venerupis]RLJ61228.1 putative secreted protein (Por secretion system target) [Lacinutrix venerupis]
MKKHFQYLVLLFLCNITYGQVVINELDCDTPSTDTKEFIELKTPNANTSLDGYVLVLFNGSNTSSTGGKSYYTLDLDGFITDVNGLFVIGSDLVTPFPQFVIPQNLIQNGPDVVAIYQANASDFPDQTDATITNLVDVLVYETNDAVTNLLEFFNDAPGFETIQQINDNGTNANPKSIQLNNDGSYTAATPTPRQLNDGSGVVFNPIAISTSQFQYTEGETFDVTFTTETNVTADTTFSFTLDNFGFNTSDYSGTTTVTIPNGQNTVSTTITLIDDTLDEGDEELLIKFSSLSTPYIPFNNFVTIRVVDNDFVIAPFGKPTTPTFDIVNSTQPDGYYDSLNGLSGANLEQAIQDIIAEEGVVRAQTYSDIIDILKEADQNPENSNQVWLLYTEQGRAKLDLQGNGSSVGKWNREHTFPRSLAGYFSIEEDDIADGIETYWNTTADSLRHGNSDAHALRAADGPENSSRGNQHYGGTEYNGPTGNSGSFKGDVARSVLYMQLRYNGLSVENGFPTANGQMGDLATLLQWHNQDPPDDFEMNRNNVIYTWQFNRNPLIDMPELVDYIWGANVGQQWQNTLSVNNYNKEIVKLYPNPVDNQLFVSGAYNEYHVIIYSAEGRKIESHTLKNNSALNLDLSSGMYYAKISTEGNIETKKFIVK